MCGSSSSSNIQCNIGAHECMNVNKRWNSYMHHMLQDLQRIFQQIKPKINSGYVHGRTITSLNTSDFLHKSYLNIRQVLFWWCTSKVSVSPGWFWRCWSHSWHTRALTFYTCLLDQSNNYDYTPSCLSCIYDMCYIMLQYNCPSS